MHHYHRRTLGMARVKAHAINASQVKRANALLLIGFAILSSMAFASILFTH